MVAAEGNGTDTTVTITASYGGASTSVEVISAEVDTLELNHTSIVLNKGEDQL